MSGMFYDLPFFSKGAGEDGVNGVSPTLTITDIEGGHRLTIVDVKGTRTVDILDGATGPQGIQGPAGKDGAAGKDGVNGTNGKDGTNGTNGKDGRGITSITINGAGELVIVYTDNTQVNLGKVVGSDGTQGVQGEQGPAGEKGEQGPAGPQGEPGEQGPIGPEGPQGPTYVLTEADKEELIAAVKEAVLAELNPQT